MGIDIPSFQPGSSDIVSALQRVNALTQMNQDIEKNRILNKYLPITTLANAASKSTYANLMGPQYTAKLFGNEKIWANIPEEKKQEIQNWLLQSGTGNNPALNALHKIQETQQPDQSTGNPLLDFLFTKTGVFKNNNKQNMGTQNQPQPGQNQQPIQRNNQRNWTSSNESYGLPPSPENPNEGQMQPGNQSPYSYQTNVPPTQMTSAQNVGTSKGIEKEGEQLGVQRAKGIEEFDNSYQSGVEASVPIDHLIDIAKNPLFQGLRKYPGFQGLQLGAKANFGNQQEQELIGDFQTTVNEALKAGVLSFRGRVLDKEIGIANKIKINENDPVGVIMGKLPSIKMFNEMSKQRDYLASQIMQDEHIPKAKALAKADKLVNGNAIRKKVQDDLENSQMITIKNPKTGESKTITLKEARAGGFKGG